MMTTFRSSRRDGRKSKITSDDVLESLYKFRIRESNQQRNGKEPEEREFVVDSGANMHMVSEKDLNSAELETMRTSRSPTTVMTANGEVRTSKEATVCVLNNRTYSSLLCFFKKLPQCFHWGNSAKNMGTRITGKDVKIHISTKMARELIAIIQLCTICGSWNISEFFLNYAFIYFFTIFITRCGNSSIRKKWRYE